LGGAAAKEGQDAANALEKGFSFDSFNASCFGLLSCFNDADRVAIESAYGLGDCRVESGDIGG
jgi:hypothetical protein